MGRKSTKRVDPFAAAAKARADELRRLTTEAQTRRAERRPENWGPNAKALASQPDVSVRNGHAGKVHAVRREDVFHRMHARGALTEAALMAIRRLDADMTERRGEGGRDTAPSGGGGYGARDLVSQRMLDAGDRVDVALRQIGRRDSAMLHEMLEPKNVMVAEGVDRWRLVVAVSCGERHDHAQGAVLRSACENLALGYQEIDRMVRKAS